MKPSQLQAFAAVAAHQSIRGAARALGVSVGTLRHAVEELNKDELESCWADDMTLGWVYQFWQADNKERINKSEVKIGADELCSCTNGGALLACKVHGRGRAL